MGLLSLALLAGWQLALCAQQTTAATAAPPATAGELAAWQQCGGTYRCTEPACSDAPWPGATCAEGTACQRVDSGFWQCRPSQSKQAAEPATAPSPVAAVPEPTAPPPAAPKTEASQAGRAEPQRESQTPPGPPAGNKQVQLWQQCGGESQCSDFACVDAPWTGASCVPGAECIRQDNYYWQCKPSQSKQAAEPGAAPGPVVAAVPEPAAAPQPASAAGNTTSPAASGSTSANGGSSANFVPTGITAIVNDHCEPYIDTQKYRKTNFTDTFNTTTKPSPLRPNADRPQGEWIPGRATFYAASQAHEAAHVACGEPPGQYGILEQGSCGFTNADGSLVYPKEVYAAAADTNIDFPGSCGRCYEVRCKTGAVYNNGRPLRISDLQYGRPYPKLADEFGRLSPGNPRKTEDLVYVQCWNDTKSIIVRVGDSCPCQYPIKDPPEIRTQYACCGGNNHFDLSFWAFQQLAHPNYGLMPLEYRPVNCETQQPLDPVPGFISKVVYDDDLRPGWGWRPYDAKNFFLLSSGAGLQGSKAMCATLSPRGAVAFFCRDCSRQGYQPFGKSQTLKFSIRSNTPANADIYASSTPAGKLPGLKVFLMKDAENKFCGAEVVLGGKGFAPAKQQGDWFSFSIPLVAFACQQGSVGNRANVDRFDFQNIDIRDADICLDNIALV